MSNTTQWELLESSFNFPVAVWAWNTALAWICGDVCVWKPSEKTPLCGIACQNIIAGNQRK
jgi:aldehyde dehydrogenase (NAD+)